MASFAPSSGTDASAEACSQDERRPRARRALELTLPRKRAFGTSDGRVRDGILNGRCCERAQEDPVRRPVPARRPARERESDASGDRSLACCRHERVGVGAAAAHPASAPTFPRRRALARGCEPGWTDCGCTPSCTSRRMHPDLAARAAASRACRAGDDRGSPARAHRGHGVRSPTRAAANRVAQPAVTADDRLPAPS